MKFFLEIFFVVFILTLFINIIYYKIYSKPEVRALRERMKKLQDKMNKARIRNDTKEISKILREMSEINRKMLKYTLSASLYTIPSIFIAFYYISSKAYALNLVGKKFVKLPFQLFFFDSLGWLGWYIFCFFTLSILTKKIFKLEY